ncbi:MAG: PD40 domain-containing protein [Spirochaetales bacterium]|nr:PD40 domain-containing protein [Spirochaetales bacterium]
MPTSDRFFTLSAAVVMTATLVLFGTGCTPQQRVTLTDTLVYARSMDELHVGWAQKTADGRAVLSVDGQIRSREYEEFGFIVFSPDSRHVVYSVKTGDKWRVMVDDAPGPEFDEISIIDVTFSPDGKRLAYGARSGGAWHAVLDGKAVLPGGSDMIRHVAFSPDSRRFAFIAFKGNRQAFVVDGARGPLVDKAKAFVWSPDGGRFAYIAEENGRKSVVLDGTMGPKYEDVRSPVFSFDGRHFAYSARKNGKSLVVTDGKEGPLFDTDVPIEPVRFALSDDRLGYVANKGALGGWVAVIDGKEAAHFPYIISATLALSPDGRGYAYVAAMDKSGWIVVTESNRGPVLDDILGPIYSLDGRHIVYAAKKENRLYLYVDGAASQELEYKDISDFSFSADGKHLMYRAYKDNSQLIVLDGRRSPEYDRVYRPAFTESGVEYLAERDSDGGLWRGVIPFTGEQATETKLGWLPTLESMANPCDLCEKQKELLKEEESE